MIGMTASFKVLLSLLLLLLALPAAVQAQFTFTTNNGTITIIGYTGPAGAVTIPSTTNGLPVTCIGAYAFYMNTGLTNVTIPNSVTNIGDMAFGGCTSLTAITVDTNNSAYSSLDGVLFNKLQTTLIAYPEGKAGSYMIPKSVTSIGDYAFSYCSSLSFVTIGTNVASIGTLAFWFCSSLTSVTIGTNVTSIGAYAFCGCTSLTALTVDPLNSIYSSVDGVLFNKSQTRLIEFPGGKSGIYTIPDSVTYIGAMAFRYCTSLTSLTIPNSVTNIGLGAFWSSTSLSTITMDTDNPVYSSLDGALFNKNQTMLVAYPGGKAGSYTIPKSVTNIGYGALCGCTGLTSVTIPNSVTNIGKLAFWFCSSLTSVTIGANVTSIGAYAFETCTSLANVTIPNSVTSIGEFAFYECTNLTGLYFQGNARSLGADVLYNDYNTTVYYLPETTGWGTTFGGRPAVLWNPQVQTSGASFGVHGNQFGFNLTGTTNIPILVEACTNLATASWASLQTCTVTNGSIYFSDPQCTNYPTRIYRIRSP